MEAQNQNQKSPSGLWKLFFKRADGTVYHITKGGQLRSFMERYGHTLSQRYAKQGQFLKAEPAIGSC